MAAKALRRIYHKVSRLIRRCIDARKGTHYEILPQGKIYAYFPAIPVRLLEPQQQWLGVVTQNYLDHRFDLLGSGWVQVKHGRGCRGLEGHKYPDGAPVEADPQGAWLHRRINPANVAESQRLWKMVTGDYQPLAWQVDFKSGYGWSENTWYGDIPWGHEPGVDIKVPWELARMQHLPHLAWAYALAQAGAQGFKPAAAYLTEFRNQLLDFMATNPPRYGVNWRCSMDVALRAANWLVAYDLFRGYGVRFEADFAGLLQRSLYEHGRHILGNLEWQPDWRGNHYLANVAGLLFIAAYLPCSPQVDAWLAFAVQELVGEVNYQFHAEGTNFEASTSYHRLSAEMAVYATALVLGLPPEKRQALKSYDHGQHRVRPRLQPAPLAHYPVPGSDRDSPFPAWYWERLEKMAEFTLHLTKPNGRVPQIGDNDSGRFLKLQPVYHLMTVGEAKARYLNLAGYDDLPEDSLYPVEDHLDHRHLVGAANALFQRPDFAAATGISCWETEVLGQVSGGLRIASYHRQGDAAAAARGGLGSGRAPGAAECSAPPEAGAGKAEWLQNRPQGGTLWAYPDFGLYIYRVNQVYLGVRCGTAVKQGPGAHVHNDQLSIELAVDGKDFFVDPGTYTYTPLPDQRNLFRSTAWHNTLYAGHQEQSLWDPGIKGLFAISTPVKPGVPFCSEQVFKGEIAYDRVTHTRTIRLVDAGIEVIDESSCPHRLGLTLQVAPDVLVQPSSDGAAIDLISGTTQLTIEVGPRGWIVEEGAFSPGYGWLQTASRLQWRGRGHKISWQIKIS